MNTIQRLGAAVIATVALVGAAGPAQAAAPADLWTSKIAMNMAWAEQSYSDRVDICDAFDIAPTYVVGRLVKSQSGLSSYERTVLRSWMRSFLMKKCSRI